MSEDIVARLRAVLHDDKSVELMNREAADEIGDLRFQLEGTTRELENALSRERSLMREREDSRIGADNLAAEIERLRREVKETQMNACYAFARRAGVNLNAKALWYAKQMGWKCFEGGTE